MNRFDGQTVLITGATSGMGASHVRGFHAAGAQVVIAARDLDAASSFASSLGPRASAVRLDVTSEPDWIAAIEQIGPLSVLVNNAGAQHPAALIEDTPLPTWERTLAVNLTGQFLGIKHATPSLRAAGGGTIINIASTMANVGQACYAPYVASKWALRGLTRTAALELGRDNIRVNSIHPGVVATPLITEPIADQPPIGDLYSPAPFAVPRLGTPEEVTALILHLVSPDGAFATGAEFVLDGGLLLGPALAA
ncbi:SDR family oxidoreductase [Lentzea sp. NBRC 102530]|uniref:SDR family NAD(P)-dependent oxidoreductase n=1 Tax=Lentzea sp. NBRC 102530 TaxID=3032201 RepID=UPI0024A25934|nr:SDR family oxidoreductase [Lentzea sp. NBRC 102530]GLY50531.1 3-alpha-hydroxysteroid dehydrogenase [Lentzea sp. NBRC 102530]